MQRLSSLVRSLSSTGSGAEPGDTDQSDDNRTLFQAFEWYLPGPGGDSGTSATSHYTLLEALLPHLSALGISQIWIPPGCKATSVHDNGYAIYDLWDLGEFDAKANGKPSRTKWGSKAELESFCAKAEELGIGVLWDTVLNHKAAADGKETSVGLKVDANDRTKALTKPYELETWTKFTFPGRGRAYSDMSYDWTHFSGVDYDCRKKEQGIFKFIAHGKRNDWAHDVSKELGNYDFLMFADLDHSHPAVRSDIFSWGEWITSTLGLGGMRLDALLERNSSMFDVQLVYKFSDFSKGKQNDLRTIFDGTLVQRDHAHAVASTSWKLVLEISRLMYMNQTFVANHDTQETQSLAAPVEEWFIPLAYTLILLRDHGGTPCVFWGDMLGNQGPRPRLPACRGKLARLIAARKLYAYGPQRDYFDSDDCIGWTRLDHKSRPTGAGLAVIMTNSWDRRSKKMFVGRRHVGEKWKDVLGWEDTEVVIDSRGFGDFRVGHRSVSVWTHEKAPEFDKLGRFTFPRLGQSAVAPSSRLLPG